MREIRIEISQTGLVIIFSSLIIIFVIIYGFYSMHRDFDNINLAAEGVSLSDFAYFDRLSLRYNESIGELARIHGFYSGTGYYCVWIKGLNESSIEYVDLHEKCHYMVDEWYEHFCKPCTCVVNE